MAARGCQHRQAAGQVRRYWFGRLSTSSSTMADNADADGLRIWSNTCVLPTRGCGYLRGDGLRIAWRCGERSSCSAGGLSHRYRAIGYVEGAQAGQPGRQGGAIRDRAPAARLSELRWDTGPATYEQLRAPMRNTLIAPATSWCRLQVYQRYFSNSGSA